MAKQELDIKLEDEFKALYCPIKSETRKVIYRTLSENAKIRGDMLEDGKSRRETFSK